MLIKINYLTLQDQSKTNPPRVSVSCREGFQQYTVVAGDTFRKIAQRYNVTVDFLSAENPHISNPNLIFPGDIICVPGPVTSPGTGRVPASCPLDYQQYTVQAGDTINQIAARLGISNQLLITNNPHITDPNLIFPGDVLCVPTPLNLPCCSILKAVGQDGNQTYGAAVVQKIANNQHQLAILGVGLPNPASLGSYDMYQGFVSIAGIGGYGFSLFRAGEQSSTWAGTLEIQAFLSAGNQVFVQPANSQTGAMGSPVLAGKLGEGSCFDKV